MLTDYHTHLRPDDIEATAAEYFTAANAERYREAAGERGIVELGVSEHIHRFRQALEVWQHPFWQQYALDDLDDYCHFVRQDTDLRLGIEADFIPGAEDRTANLLQARDFDYVVGSVHFLRDQSLDMEDWSVWTEARSAEDIWRRYFHTLGEAARSGLFDILAHPDLVKVWGSGAALARRAIFAATTSLPSMASPSRASPSRSQPPACASVPRRSTPRRLSLRCASKPVAPSRSQAMPTGPRTSAPTTSRRSSCSSVSAWASSASSSTASGASEPIGAGVL